jgi:hypothetical protein
MSEPTVYDIMVTSTFGSSVYAVAPESKRAERWLRQHCPDAIWVEKRGYSYLACDGARLCRDLVAGAVAAGLRVEVNGVDMKGFRAA